MEEHAVRICQVLHRIFVNKLYVKAEKFEYNKETVSFLHH